ncbi:MAG TPA: hypothetical protein VL500_05870 [Candidatus Eisenbacteria bacterium]|jgi:hypothetical protein|nr:hypothetical protein [Candidatus Eisenbacteria bacterium]
MLKLQWKGEQQEGRVGKPLDPFEIVVKDETGEPAQLITVEFKVVQGAGEFSYKDERTDLGGNVIAEFIPSEDGWYRVECFIGEGDDRQVVPFKGSIKPDRRKRNATTMGVSDNWQEPAPPAGQHAATVIPIAAVPPPIPPAEQASPPALPVQPIVQVTVSVPPQAVPMAAPKVVEASPPQPPKPAAVPQATAPRQAAAAQKPKPAPKPVQAPRPQPQAIAAVTAVLPRPVIRQVQAPRPAVQPVAKKRRASKPPVPAGLLVAIVVLYALLIGSLAVLAVQTSNPSPRTASIECTSDAWVVTGNTVTFRRCMATLR